MITVGAPWVLGVAGIGAVITGVLHFLSVRRPPTLMLPTMRFLPDRPVRAVSRSARPSDLLLLLMRVAALLLAGVAMARVSWNHARIVRGRVVIIDKNRVDTSATALRDAAAIVLRNRPVTADSAAHSFVATHIVVVDSLAHVLSASEARSFRPETLTVTHASVPLSSMLLASVRAASIMVREESQVDSVELEMVSSFTGGTIDAALPAVRRMWPGAMRLIDVPVTSAIDSGKLRVETTFVGETPNAAVLAAFGLSQSSVRNRDSLAQHVHVEWPAVGVPAGWTAQRADTIGAVVAGGQALVFPFVRAATVPDSLARVGRAIAWWSDGRVAALERATADGCVRQVGIAVPSSSDALLGAPAHTFLSALMAACGASMRAAPLGVAERELLAGKAGAASAASFRPDATTPTPFASAMLLLALLLLALEWWIRDRERAAGHAATSAVPLRKVA